MILFSQCLDLIAGILFVFLLIVFAAIRTRKTWLRLPAAVLLLALLLILYFFRNPDRSVYAERGAVLSPADGTVVDTAAALPVPGGIPFRSGVGVYLSLFDVHINRIPVTGVVISREYKRGGFFPAFSRKAAGENEYLLLGIQTDVGICYVKQIAGFIARTIVCHVDVGDTVRAGEPYGMIKFGSRVEIFPPGDPERRVAPGDKVSAGITELFHYENE